MSSSQRETSVWRRNPRISSQFSSSNSGTSLIQHDQSFFIKERLETINSLFFITTLGNIGYTLLEVSSYMSVMLLPNSYIKLKWVSLPTPLLVICSNPNSSSCGKPWGKLGRESMGKLHISEKNIASRNKPVSYHSCKRVSLFIPALP